MNPIRRDYALRAFKKCDKDNNGMLELSDIKGVYNAKMHPDVKSGKKTEDEILLEFLDTFEVHHAMKHPHDRDGKVSQNEFLEYYNNVSASIDDDQYFELMITNAWNLNDTNYSKGWGTDL